MALFSRRPKVTSDQPARADQVEPPADESRASGAEPATGDVTADAEHPEDAASVDISVSSFEGLGASTPRVPAAEAPVPSETVPGLRDNVLVREALSALSDPATSPQLLNLARQLMQGHLFLRVKGDARTLLSEGRDIPLAVVTIGEQSFVLAYSSGAALQASVRADGDTETSAMGQPVLSVLRHLLAGPYDGLILDHASAPASASLSRELLERLIDEIDEALTVKTLLAEERTSQTAAAVVDALSRVRVWVAVGGREGELPGIAEVRAEDGSRFLEVFSHPIEVAAMGRSDRPAPLAGPQLAGALRSDEGITGVVINPQGPWIRLTRDDLAPLIALAS